MNTNMYVPNNIEFRIISSGAIAKFKQDQAFDFNEIVNTSTYKFARESKEILLLNYEIWFKFITKLEKLFIRYHTYQATFTEDLSGLVDVLIDDCINEIDEVMTCNPSVFHSETRHILARTHSLFIDYIYYASRENIGNSIAVHFPSLVLAISNSLHNLLFQLHEIEVLKGGVDEPFISYSKECKLLITQLGKYPVLHRAEVYREFFNQHKFNLKNYTNEMIDESCVNKLLENGIMICTLDSESSPELIKMAG